MICKNCLNNTRQKDICYHCGNNPNIKTQTLNHHLKPQTKKGLWKIWLFVTVVIVLVLFLSITETLQKPEFPSLTNPRTNSYTWTYKEQTYELDLIVYENVYKYFQDEYYTTFSGDEEEDYTKFTSIPPEDLTIKNISDKLIKLGKKNSLNNDEIADLALNYVQYISYDSENIEYAAYHPRYPYQVLYDKKGVCSGKSFLLYSILKEMGYGVILFSYDPISDDDYGHLAVGIQCTEKYSDYRSGYCFGESTTSGYKFGDIPNFDDKGQAVNRELQTYNNVVNSSDTNGLGKRTSWLEIKGSVYTKILENNKINQRIESLDRKMSQLELSIDGKNDLYEEYEDEASSLEQEMDSHDSYGDYWNYNRLVPEYNDSIYEMDRLFKLINTEINEYNKTVAEYNKLINP